MHPQIENRLVVWRQAFLLSIGICLLTYLVLYFLPRQMGIKTIEMNQKVTLSLFAILFVLIMALLYFEKNYQIFHLYRLAQDNIEKSTKILRQRVACEGR